MNHFLKNYKIFSLIAFSLALVLSNSSALSAQSQPAQFTPIFQEVKDNVLNVKYTQELEIIRAQDDGFVLAECTSTSGPSPEGCPYEMMISAQPLCVEGQTSVDYADGDEIGEGAGSVTVRKNSRIQVWRVTSPLPIYAGSEYVKNDRMPISKEFPTVPSAANYIDPAMARGLCAPGKDCEGVDSVVGNASSGRYAVGASAQIGTGNPQGGSTERTPVVIEPRLSSYCPTIQDSDPNPDKTNKLAANLEPRFQTPGAHDNSRSLGGNTQLRCETATPEKVLTTANVFLSCVNERKTFDFITRTQIKLSQWFECLEDEGNCEETELFAIKIDAIYGAQTECKEGDCANSWFASVVKSGDMPKSASYVPEGMEAGVNKSFSKPTYVTTPCQVRIDSDRIEDIQCLWDISPIREWYYRQRKTSAPGDPDFPATFEDYFASVAFDADRRGLRCE